jgi:hypothetical protein
MNYEVERDFSILSTKLMSENVLQKMDEWGSWIHIDKTSKYWPTRIQGYFTEYPTFLDHKKKKSQEDQKGKKSKKKPNPIEDE